MGVDGSSGTERTGGAHTGTERTGGDRTDRFTILERAREAVAQREAAYGSPAGNAARVAAYTSTV